MATLGSVPQIESYLLVKASIEGELCHHIAGMITLNFTIGNTAL